MDEIIRNLETLESRVRRGDLNLAVVRYQLSDLVALVEKMARKIKELEEGK